MLRFHDQRTRLQYTIEFKTLSPNFDLTLTFGGDGTLLTVSSLFQTLGEIIPPVVSFSLGTLNFLPSFRMYLFKV
jgi:NAD kinase